MALPANVDVESGNAEPVRKGSSKLRVVASIMAVSMVACVALLAPGSPTPESRGSELLAISADTRLNELAMHMLKHADTMPESTMLSLLRDWR